MLDGDHYTTHGLVDQLLSNAQMKHSLDLIEALKPKLTVENDKFIYNYNDIIFGEGSTVYEAMLNFQRKFYSQKANGN